MKKIILLVLTVLLLTGCGKEQEQETTPFTISGVYDSSISYEESVSVNLSNDSGFYEISFPIGTVDIDQLQPGYEITVSGTTALPDEENLQQVYNGEVLTIDNIPLELQLGYDGYDLMSQDYDYTFSSLLAKVEYSYTRSNSGRVYSGASTVSRYTDQDENAIYFQVTSDYTNEDGTKSSSSSMGYINRHTGDMYSIQNYGEWEQGRADNTELVTFSIAKECLSVDEFSLLGDTLSVSGTLTAIPTNSYLSTLIDETIGELSEDALPRVSFVGKFNQVDKTVKYMEYTVTFDESLHGDDGDYTVDNLNITLSGIVFDNTQEVVIPSYAMGVQVEPEAPEEPTVSPIEEVIFLCTSHFGLDVGQVTFEYVDSIIPEQYADEATMAECAREGVVNKVIEYLTTMSYEQFISEVVDESWDTSKVCARSVLLNILEGNSVGVGE